VLTTVAGPGSLDLTAGHPLLGERPVRVLIVEDDPDDYAATRSLFFEIPRQEFRIEWAATYDEALQAIERREHDVYLLDYYLGSGDGVGLFRAALRCGCSAPVIFLTGNGCRETDLAAMRLGAADFLVKGKTDAILLERSIRYSLERARTIEALRLFSSAVEQSAEAIVIASAPRGPFAATVDYVNPGFSRMTAYARGEIVGQSLDLLRGPKTDARALEEFEAALDGDEPALTEVIAYRRGGDEFWLSWHATPIRDEAGHVTHVLSLMQDVTERRRLESERKRLEQELLQAQKLEAIGRFVGSVSHDFNNLLSVVTGFSELLLRGLPEDDPLHAYAREVAKAGARGSEFTRQLLSFTRRRAPEPTVVDLDELIGEFAGLLRSLVGEQIAVETSLSGPSLVEVDVGEIHQILLNLAVNARDAMPHGGRLVAATATAADEVLLSVTDDGHGMDEQTLARAADPYFTTKGECGTGVGLATVKAIAERSGGRLVIESEPGRGTTATVFLPRADGIDDLPPLASDEWPVETLPTGTESVLVVDDEEGVRELLALALAEAGYHVAQVSTPAEALELLEQGTRIDLLVTDMLMPGLRGDVLAEHVRRIDPYVKTLYVSGWTDGASLGSDEAALEANLIRKPFTLEEVARAARRALDGVTP
jgi:two-component system cell cycle sensor histidine kinase/response regulator CckA